MFSTIIFLITHNKYIYSQENDKVYLKIQERPPYFIYKKGTNTPEDGVTYKIIVKILNNANIPYEFVDTPTVRVISEIKENKTNVCFPNAFKNKEREDFSAFSKSYFQDKKTAILIRKNDIMFKGIS